MVFAFDRIAPPLCLSAPFLLRVLPWQRQRALRLGASIPLPELWLCRRNCQSASQIGWRGGGDCVNIFWLTEMEGHSGGKRSEVGGKLAENLMLGGKAQRESALHLAEDTPIFPYLAAKAGDKGWRRISWDWKGALAMCMFWSTENNLCLGRGKAYRL